MLLCRVSGPEILSQRPRSVGNGTVEIAAFVQHDYNVAPDARELAAVGD
jgi:hypothetical protein